MYESVDIEERFSNRDKIVKIEFECSNCLHTWSERFPSEVRIKDAEDALGTTAAFNDKLSDQSNVPIFCNKCRTSAPVHITERSKLENGEQPRL